MFIDEATIYVKGGDGGNGCIAFLREKYVPFGGPAGGDGGRGGDVILYVDPHLNTLYHFTHQRHFRAERGQHGRGKNQHGASGADLRVPVPPGTIVRDAATGRILADLTEPGQEVVVARGGRGGRGNARFATPSNQAPRIAEKGEPGEERTLHLELKLLADVGLVGRPNAGKSTLLAAVTAARPKIAPYPFTTLHPYLGVVALDEQTTFVMADLPGLIEGASEGKGLGHDFLRHVERTRLLIHLLDGTSEDPVQDFRAINAELAAFGHGLDRKPQLVAFNKMDLPEARNRWPAVRDALRAQGYEVFPVSGLTREGVRELLWRAAQLLAQLPRAQPVAHEIPVFRLEDDERTFWVEREPDGWRVRGKRVERLVAMTPLELDEAVQRLHRRLERMGVLDALREAGVRPGDIVRIGDAELVWEEEGLED
ncbi:MAG: GTPase ObgE [Thermoflexia bacterium]|nr:MAG: GTPase ObgE [Thermoflexia bacterium]